jgi:imidazolonepropionase-like amidohydrolase
MAYACAPPEAGKTKVILGATLLEAGAAPVSPSAIVVSGSRVLRAGTQAETPIPAGSEKLAALGKFVIAQPAAIPARGFGREAELQRQRGLAPAEIFAILAKPAGSLKPGETADLWLLDGDPVDNPALLDSPARILKEGEWKK